jgi:hypothetical protein
VIRTAALAATVAGIVALAGCGGSNGPSKSGYVAKANKICADGNDAVRTIAKDITAAQRASKPAEIYRRVGDLTRKAAATSKVYIDRLDALETPKKDGDRLDAWVASVRKQETLLGQLGAAFSAKDTKQIAVLSQQIDQLDQRNNLFAKGYGMKSCATSITS